LTVLTVPPQAVLDGLLHDLGSPELSLLWYRPLRLAYPSLE